MVNGGLDGDVSVAGIPEVEGKTLGSDRYGAEPVGVSRNEG